MPPTIRVPPKYAQFKSTLKEYMSYSGSPISLAFNRPGFNIRYLYPHELRYPTTLSILEKSWHPLKILLQERWDEMRTDQLWVFYNANPMGNVKAVVRTTFTKRLRRALKTALESKGYDVDGRANGGLPLKGTVIVTGTPEWIKVEDEDMIKGFSDAIVGIEEKGPRQMA